MRPVNKYDANDRSEGALGPEHRSERSALESVKKEFSQNPIANVSNVVRADEQVKDIVKAVRKSRRRR